MTYKGILVAFDNYMNLQMINTEEWIDGDCRGNIGEVLIRCNNVLYIRDTENVVPVCSRSINLRYHKGGHISFKELSHIDLSRLILFFSYLMEG